MSTHARVSTYRFPPEAIDTAIAEFERPMTELDEQLEEAVLLVDRETGKAVTITYWPSADVMRETRQVADQARRGATSAGSGSVESVEEYEVALKQ